MTGLLPFPTARLGLLVLVWCVLATQALAQSPCDPCAPMLVRFQPGGPVRYQSPTPMPLPSGVIGDSGSSLLTPSVSIRVRVPAESAVGKELTYRLTVENTSRAQAHHVTARVPLPPGVRIVRSTPEATDNGKALLWKFGTLNPAAVREITLVVLPEEVDEIALCGYVQFEHGQCVRTKLRNRQVARPPTKSSPNPPPLAGEPLALAVHGPTEAIRPDIAPFNIVVVNNGSTPLKNVVVKHTLPKGMQFILDADTPGEKASEKLLTSAKEANPRVWTIGTLAPKKEVKLEMQVMADAPGAQMMETMAQVGGLKPTVRTRLMVREMNVRVGISGPAQRLVGRPATYHLTVTNPGTATTRQIKLENELKNDDVPADALEFAEASDGGKFEHGRVSWELGDLAPGGRKTVSVTIKAKMAGKLENVVTVGADRGLLEQAKAITRFDKAEKLAVEIAPSRNPLEVGKEAVLRVRVYNAGKENEGNVSLTVELPPGLTLLGAPGLRDTPRPGQPLTFASLKLNQGEAHELPIRVRATKAGEQRLRVNVAHGDGKSLAMEDTVEVVPR